VSVTISVVLCSRNGERVLPVALDRLGTQTLDPSGYEVIVVDDGSSDRTSEVAQAHGAKVVRLEPAGGLGAARNAGVRVAEGKIVAFTDDDCEPAPDWLSAIAAAFSDPQLDGVSGRVVPSCANGFLHRYLSARNPLAPLPAELLRSHARLYRLWLYLRTVLTSPVEPPDGSELYALVGANMAFRRDLIRELGGFEEAFMLGGEEQEFCARAHARNGKARLRYDRSPVVVHRFAPRLRDSFRRARAYGRANAVNSAKHPEVSLIVYPAPVVMAAVIGGLLATRRGLRLAPLVLGGPLAFYLGWLGDSWRTRSLEPLTYPYIQLVQEVSTMLGELDELRADNARTTRRSEA
jgi:GT2 family glycosyltransferase